MSASTSNGGVVVYANESAVATSYMSKNGNVGGIGGDRVLSNCYVSASAISTASGGHLSFNESGYDINIQPCLLKIQPMPRL